MNLKEGTRFYARYLKTVVYFTMKTSDGETVYQGETRINRPSCSCFTYLYLNGILSHEEKTFFYNEWNEVIKIEYEYEILDPKIRRKTTIIMDRDRIYEVVDGKITRIFDDSFYEDVSRVFDK